jgi:hypothetical protein
VSAFEPPTELDEIQDQADEVGKLTPREYAKLRGMSPQLVYYYIRNKVVTEERCVCGRRVVDVKAADEALAAQTRKRGSGLDTRSDGDRAGDVDSEGT